jgi:hypothetical protein
VKQPRGFKGDSGKGYDIRYQNKLLVPQCKLLGRDGPKKSSERGEAVIPMRDLQSKTKISSKYKGLFLHSSKSMSMENLVVRKKWKNHLMKTLIWS